MKRCTVLVLVLLTLTCAAAEEIKSSAQPQHANEDSGNNWLIRRLNVGISYGDPFPHLGWDYSKKKYRSSEIEYGGNAYYKVNQRHADQVDSIWGVSLFQAVISELWGADFQTVKPFISLGAERVTRQQLQAAPVAFYTWTHSEGVVVPVNGWIDFNLDYIQSLRGTRQIYEDVDFGVTVRFVADPSRNKKSKQSE